MQKLLSNKNFIIYSGHSQTNQQLIWEILLNEWFYFLYLNILMITLKEGFECKPFFKYIFSLLYMSTRMSKNENE